MKFKIKVDFRKYRDYSFQKDLRALLRTGIFNAGNKAV